jgi:hypothetical protein
VDQHANPTAGCSAVGKEHSNQAGNYLRISSAVTWHQQEAAKEKAVEQYSIITPPDGSGLEVDVLNGLIPLQPVAGVTVIAGEGESTTGAAGCVIFGGIPATRINVEAFKVGDVTETGAIKKLFPEVLVVPNRTTHVEAVLNQGAAITAKFFHGGEAVTGDTFVAANSKLEPAPNFELGSTLFNEPFGAEGEYYALPAGGTGSEPYTEAKMAYQAQATTPISSKYYPTGDLFPFESAWTVYPGDCAENSPYVVNKIAYPLSSLPSVAPTPGQDATVNVFTSYVLLNAYSGSQGTPGLLESTSRPVKITNLSCASSKPPDNASSFSTIHLQNTTEASAPAKQGHLEAPYQPFGKFKLCLWDQKTEETYTTEYTNETEAGSSINLYLKETTEFESTSKHFVKVAVKQKKDTC